MRLIIPLIIVISFVFLFWFFLQNTGNTVLQETLVTKVIDGDTFLIEGGTKVRMLGIDTDERGYPCYSEAKTALEGKILNKYVVLEMDREDRDQYDRLLRWVWVNDTLINFELVKQGFAVARFEQDAKYQEEIRAAEHAAIENKIGCKWSSLE